MSDTTNTNQFVCCANTAESCFELKVEADSDSVIDYQHDDMTNMGTFILFISLFVCDIFAIFYCGKNLKKYYC